MSAAPGESFFHVQACGRLAKHVSPCSVLGLWDNGCCYYGLMLPAWRHQRRPGFSFLSQESRQSALPSLACVTSGQRQSTLPSLAFSLPPPPPCDCTARAAEPSTWGHSAPGGAIGALGAPPPGVKTPAAHRTPDHFLRIHSTRM
jgi:hypothetical protein